MGGKVNTESETGQKIVASSLPKSWAEYVVFVKMSPNRKRTIRVRGFIYTAKAKQQLQRLLGVLINQSMIFRRWRVHLHHV